MLYKKILLGCYNCLQVKDSLNSIHNLNNIKSIAFFKFLLPISTIHFATGHFDPVLSSIVHFQHCCTPYIYRDIYPCLLCNMCSFVEIKFSLFSHWFLCLCFSFCEVWTLATNWHNRLFRPMPDFLIKRVSCYNDMTGYSVFPKSWRYVVFDFTIFNVGCIIAHDWLFVAWDLGLFVQIFMSSLDFTRENEMYDMVLENLQAFFGRIYWMVFWP